MTSRGSAAARSVSWIASLAVVVFLHSPLAAARTVTGLKLPAPLAVEGATRAALSLRRELGEPHATLRLERVTPVPRGAVVRFAQIVDGHPVHDTEVSVLVLDGQVVAVSGSLVPLTALGPAPTESTRRVEGEALRRLPGARLRRPAELGVLAGPGLPRWAWALDLVPGSPLGSPRVVVGDDGQPLRAEPGWVGARGKVYSTNPVVGALAEVELPGLVEGGGLSGRYADVASCKRLLGGALSCSRFARPDANGDFLYSPTEPSYEDPFAEVQAYYQVDRYRRWLGERFGFRRGDGDLPLGVFVNMHEETAKGPAAGSSYYGDLDQDGERDVVLMQSDARDKAYDADVIFHEYTHGVVDVTSHLQPTIDALGYNGDPLALNEGFADLWAAIFTGDPNIAEYAAGDKPFYRSLAGSATCSSHRALESHIGALGLMQAAWEVRVRLKGPRDLDDALYLFMVSLPKHAGFVDATMLLKGLVGREAPRAAPLLEAALQARGFGEGCSRVLPLPLDSIQTTELPGRSVLPSSFAEVPGLAQYRIDVPRDAPALRVVLRPAGTCGFWLRRAGPVLYRGTLPPLELVRTLTPGATGVTLSVDDADAPLVPGASYFVLPFNRGSGGAKVELIAQVLGPNAPTDARSAGPRDLGSAARRDAGPSDAATAAVVPPPFDTGGCACRLAASADDGGRTSWMLALLAALLVRTRRAPERARKPREMARGRGDPVYLPSQIGAGGTGFPVQTLAPPAAGAWQEPERHSV
ncbi:MAG: hypothetical protein IT371_06830 [Deltaproteobacteria bacterium]|nr:hypothetical protein [Deltaproteobacteria bacterium]